MTWLWRALAAPLVAASVMMPAAGGAQTYSEQQELIDQATITLRSMLADPDFANLRSYIARSHGVLISPRIYKGGFIVGAEGGTAVMLVRDSGGGWRGPAFYNVAAGSFGLQIGGQVSEVVFTIMNQAAVQVIQNGSFNLGADASFAAGTLGQGRQTATTSLSFTEDIYSFARTQGLFGGGALEGAGITAREDWNQMYYGPGATALQILSGQSYPNYGANDLRQVLHRAGAGTP
jgi:lipid-binding SYLF domain-containing protein